MLLKLAPAAAYGRYVPGRSEQSYWSTTGLGTSQRQLRYVGSGGIQLPAAPVVPRHERSLYRMSKRSRPPTSQRGKGSKPRRPGDWPRGGEPCDRGAEGPFKGRGATPSARPVRCMLCHCIAANSSHIEASQSDVATAVRRNVPTRPD